MRELELIYRLYEEEFEPVEMDTSVEVREELKDKLFEMFKQQPARLEKPKAENIEQGGLYLMFIGHVPVYYVVYEKIGELYEVIKASTWTALAAQNDFLVKVDDEWFAIETWNRFYLTEDEIKSHTYIERLSSQDFEILEDILENSAKVPEDRRGLEVDLLDEAYFQTKFHKKEAEVVFDYKMRLFTDILAEEEEEEVVYLEPERVANFKFNQLAASTSGQITHREDFILNYNEETDTIEIHLYKYAGKKGTVEVAGQKVYYQQIPEIVYLDSQVELKDIDIEKLADSIKIEVEE